MILRFLKNSDEEEVKEIVQAVTDSGESDFFNYPPEQSFADYVQSVEGWSRGENLPERFVPNSFFVAEVDGKIVGRISFRHELNEFLRSYGGHIGYHVVPGHEGKGYATEMLRQVLEIAKNKGLGKVMLTCSPDNLASKHIIEKLGGIFESEGDTEQGFLRRYWIDI